MQTVLPTPGPPVRTEIRDAKAARTADHCSGVSPSAPVSGGSWSRVGGEVARAAKRLRDRDLGGVGALAVGAILVEDHAASSEQDLGLGRQAGQLRGSLAPARPPGDSSALPARLRRSRRRRPPGRGGRTRAARRRRGRSCRRGRSRRRRPRSAGRGPRGGSPSPGRRTGDGSGPQGGRGRGAPVRRGGPGSRGEACQDSAAAAACLALTPRSEPKTPAGSAAIAPRTASPCSSTRRSARVGPMWRSGRQVGDPALAVGGVEGQGALRPELPAVARVRLPVAADLGPLAGAEVGDGADQREPLAALDVLDLEHGVAVVLGAEDLVADHDDALESAGAECRLCLRRAHRPEIRARPRRPSASSEPIPCWSCSIFESCRGG